MANRSGPPSSPTGKPGGPNDDADDPQRRSPSPPPIPPVPAPARQRSSTKQSNEKNARRKTARKTAAKAAKTRSKKTVTKTARKTSPSLAVAGESPDPLHEDLAESAVRSAPAWLVSLVTHTVLLIILGLIYVSRDLPDVLTLDATYAETLGKQLDDPILQAANPDPMNIEDPALALADNPVDEPFATPPDLAPHLEGTSPSDALKSLTVGVALTGRKAGMKRALLLKYGGTATTEAAVQRALAWLKRNQRRDGLWSLKGPYSGGAFDENKTAATAMALLAFQGAGQTHQTGVYREQIEKGWRALLKMQSSDGSFFKAGIAEQQLYCQAQAMIAVCEIYGMTKDSRFRSAAQKSVDYAVHVQAPEGGWRYRPGVDTDTSVTGWYVMGLQSALMAGLQVPSPTLRKIGEYLDSVSEFGGAYYKYHPTRRSASPSMTAEGLLCRQYLGWNRSDKRLAEGIELLMDNPITWDDRDVYYWYYATQVLHHMENESWERWNRVMRQAIPEHQTIAGPESGSWDADGDRWGTHGGRLYTTCLSVYMLEVYYRHLPIYSYRLK